MRVYIPTRGRLDRQITLKTVPSAVLCVHRNEFAAHCAKYGKFRVLCIPDAVKGICNVRQWIMDMHLETCAKFAGPRLCMMDDDLTFSQRISSSTKLSQLTSGLQMLQDLEDILCRYVHAGISPREGNNRVESSYVENTRMMRVIGYDASIVRKLGVKFHSAPWFTMDDFDMTLKLMKKSVKNCVMYEYAQNQTGGSGAEGGASDYRTSESHSRSARELARVHAPFVRLVEKTTKTSWEGFGGTRTDVVISWKKAYESSIL